MGRVFLELLLTDIDSFQQPVVLHASSQLRDWSCTLPSSFHSNALSISTTAVSNDEQLAFKHVLPLTMCVLAPTNCPSKV